MKEVFGSKANQSHGQLADWREERKLIILIVQ
jgi:hypothetical protein